MLFHIQEHLITVTTKGGIKMSNFTKEMIDDYADKLLIGLTEEERTNIQEEFDEIEKIWT